MSEVKLEIESPSRDVAQETQETQEDTAKKKSEEPKLPPQLVAFSYTVQREELTTSGQQISLLLSAQISKRITPQLHDPVTLPPDPLSLENNWYVVSAGQPNRQLIQRALEAFELAAIDREERLLITPRGSLLSEITDEIERDIDLTEEQINRLGFRDQLMTQIMSISLRQEHAQARQLTELDIPTVSQAETLPDPHALKTQVSSQSSSPHTALKTQILSSHESSNTEKSTHAKTSPETTSKPSMLPSTYGHLLILASGSFESIKPRVTPERLSAFSSITVLISCAQDRVLSWHRWSNTIGGRLILTSPSPNSTISTLADRIQRLSWGTKRVAIQVTAHQDFSLTGVTQLTTQAGPLPLEMNSAGGSRRIEFWAELPVLEERWSALLNFKYQELRSPREPSPEKSVATLRIGEVTQQMKMRTAPQRSDERLYAFKQRQERHFRYPLSGALHSEYEQIQLGVAFAQLLSHYVRIADNLILALLRREARKPAKLLDQFVKLALALGAQDQANALRKLKLEFLALSELSPQSWHILNDVLTQSTHRLSSEGQWDPVPTSQIIDSFLSR